MPAERIDCTHDGIALGGVRFLSLSPRGTSGERVGEKGRLLSSIQRTQHSVIYPKDSYVSVLTKVQPLPQAGLSLLAQFAAKDQITRVTEEGNWGNKKPGNRLLQ